MMCWRGVRREFCWGKGVVGYGGRYFVYIGCVFIREKLNS